jgi:hypothetical protein
LAQLKFGFGFFWAKSNKTPRVFGAKSHEPRMRRNP